MITDYDNEPTQIDIDQIFNDECNRADELNDEKKLREYEITKGQSN